MKLIVLIPVIALFVSCNKKEDKFPYTCATEIRYYPFCDYSKHGTEYENQEKKYLTEKEAEQLTTGFRCVVKQVMTWTEEEGEHVAYECCDSVRYVCWD